MRGIAWLAANRLASQEGLCTVEWVQFCTYITIHVVYTVRNKQIQYSNQWTESEKTISSWIFSLEETAISFNYLRQESSLGRDSRGGGGGDSLPASHHNHNAQCIAVRLTHQAVHSPVSRYILLRLRYRDDILWLGPRACCSDVTPWDGQRDNCQQQQAATVFCLIVWDNGEAVCKVSTLFASVVRLTFRRPMSTIVDVPHR